MLFIIRKKHVVGMLVISQNVYAISLSLGEKSNCKINKVEFLPKKLN